MHFSLILIAVFCFSCFLWTKFFFHALAKYMTQTRKSGTLAIPALCTVEITMQAEDLLLLVSREMPYGKYQGRLIADLPGHYLGWFAREGFPKGEIGRLLALMYEIDHNNLGALLVPLRGKTAPRPR